MNPQRIQLQRTKGWRKPESAVVVSRPSVWGNPFPVGSTVRIAASGPQRTQQLLEGITPEVAVYLYRLWVTHANIADRPVNPGRLLWADLRGKDLACWCPLDQPCHADVLLELANASIEGEP